MKVLEINNLKKRYFVPEEGYKTILDIKNFNLEKSDQFVVRGRSGCGKSTFLNLIAGISQADEGSIRIEDIALDELNEAGRDQLRGQKIGYIFQSFHLLPGYTALENVILGMSFSSGVNIEFAKELLIKVGLEDRMAHMPGQLSVGQRQRVAVARALANKPCLVLADEPTANLDSEMSLIIIDLIRNLCSEREAALLLVTHDEAVIQQFQNTQSLEDINQAFEVER